MSASTPTQQTQGYQGSPSASRKRGPQHVVSSAPRRPRLTSVAPTAEPVATLASPAKSVRAQSPTRPSTAEARPVPATPTSAGTAGSYTTRSRNRHSSSRRVREAWDPFTPRPGYRLVRTRVAPETPPEMRGEVYYAEYTPATTGERERRKYAYAEVPDGTVRTLTFDEELEKHERYQQRKREQARAQQLESENLVRIMRSFVTSGQDNTGGRLTVGSLLDDFGEDQDGSDDGSEGGDEQEQGEAEAEAEADADAEDREEEEERDLRAREERSRIVAQLRSLDVLMTETRRRDAALRRRLETLDANARLQNLRGRHT